MFSPDSDGRFYNPGESNKEELEEVSGNKAVYQYKTNTIESRTIALRMMGEISAGTPIEIPNAETWKYIEIPKAFLVDKYDHYFAFMVNGRSMEPQISHGDIVVIHKRDDWFNLTGKVIAIRTADGITLKKVQYDEKRRQIFLLPFNMNFDIIVLSEEELININIIGEMAMQFRLFK
jgi:SOS-response transcriptional repressor LexA